MTSHQAPERVTRHAAAFNETVRSGNWDSFASRFTPSAIMNFTGVAAGPFTGRAAIARAYAQQPPTDTLSIEEVESAGSADTVRFAWSNGGGGVMRLTWKDQLVDSLDVTFH